MTTKLPLLNVIKSPGEGLNELVKDMFHWLVPAGTNPSVKAVHPPGLAVVVEVEVDVVVVDLGAAVVVSSSSSSLTLHADVS